MIKIKLLDEQVFKKNTDIYIYIDRKNPFLDCVGGLLSIKFWLCQHKFSAKVKLVNGIKIKMSSGASIIQLETKLMWEG